MSTQQQKLKALSGVMLVVCNRISLCASGCIHGNVTDLVIVTD